MRASQVFVCLSMAMGAGLCSSPAQAQDCNDLFNTSQVLTLDITMDAADWESMRLDCPGGVCPDPYPLPHDYYDAYLSCGTNGPYWVGIRRKNDLGEPTDADPQKVSIKIDVNLFVPGQLFAGKKKLSLECGSEGALISEGLAYNIDQAAGFIAGRSAWCRVYINGDYKGLYNNVEQVDKIFLTDAGLDNGGFLFKRKDVGEVQRTREAETSPFGFNWYPFDHPEGAIWPEVPAPGDWLDQTLWRINMPHLLKLGASENFVANTDACFFKMTNYFYYDWSILPGDDPAGQQPRLYFPWDQDTALKSQVVDWEILNAGTGHLEQGLVEELDEAGDPFGYATFQADYFQTYRDLVNGPLALSEMLTLVNTLEPVVGSHMDADPYQQTGTSAEEFQRLRDYMQARTNSIISQMAPLGEGYPLDTSVIGNGSIIRNPDKPAV